MLMNFMKMKCNKMMYQKKTSNCHGKIARFKLKEKGYLTVIGLCDLYGRVFDNRSPTKSMESNTN